MKTGKQTLVTVVWAVGMIVASGTATAAVPVSTSPAPTAFVVPTQPGGGGGSGGTGGTGTGGGTNSGGTNSGSTGSGTSGTGTTNSSTTSRGTNSTTNSSNTNSSGTISGNYAQRYTGRGNTGCPFTPGDLGCRGELMSGGQVICSPC